MAISRGLNGIGLAIVTPAIQSLVADSTDETNRGLAFGWLQVSENFGSIIGGLSSLLIASTSFMGVPGWRLSFHLVAILSLIVGILVHLFANDPHFIQNKPQNTPHKAFSLEVKHMFKEAKGVIKIPSFRIIVAQEVVGSFAWAAFSFVPMWLELIGFSHKTTAFIWTVFILATSLGGLIGGRVGDALAKWLPNYGRIALSQISSAIFIPLAAILLLALRDDLYTGFVHGLLLFVMGSIMWNGPATNKYVSKIRFICFVCSKRTYQNDVLIMHVNSKL